MTTVDTAPAGTAPSADATIGRNVDYLIWRSRETRAALAKELGVTPGALSHKLRGRRPWSATEILTVSSHYRVSIDTLFQALPELAKMPLGGPSDYIALLSPESEPATESSKIMRRLRPVHQSASTRPRGQRVSHRPGDSGRETRRPRRRPNSH